MQKRFSTTAVLRWIGVFFFLLVWQWSGDGIVFGLENGFDMGVQNMEMYTAISDSLHYGKDLLVTPYGPLGWLYKGVWLPLTGGRQGAIQQLFVLNVLNAFLRTFLIMQFWQFTKNWRDQLLTVATAACIFLAFPLSRGEGLLNLFVLVACILICRLHVLLAESGGSSQITFAYTAAIGIMLAVPQLAKFSYFAMALSLGIILSGILVVRKNLGGIGVLLGAYLGTTTFLWVLCGERLQYLFSYFAAMLHFTGGYSEIFSVSFSRYEFIGREFLLTLAVCGVYGCTLIWLFFKNKVLCVSWFAIAPYFFLIFKEAYVRSDVGHVLSFRQGVLYAICYMIFVFLIFDTKEKEVADVPRITFRYSKFFWLAILTLLLFPKIVSENWLPKNQMRSDYSVLSNNIKYENAVSAALNAVKPLESDTLMMEIDSYPDKSLGMVSSEQTFFITNDLMDRYRINPIISIWENASSLAEKMTAEYYSSGDAPDILFYRMEGLDYAYETARMGTILHALLENYHMVKLNSADYLVLERNEERTHEALEIGEPITYSIGDAIPIPKAEDQYVFMRVDWDLTLLGRLASFILKVPETGIEIQTQDRQAHQYRFYRTLATNGIYVSSLVENSWDLGQVFEGTTDNNAVQSVALTGNSLYYKDSFTVSFYGVPKTQAQIEGARKEYSVITASFAEGLPAGNFEVFWANDYAFSGEQYKKLYLDGGQATLTTSIPADGWNTLRIDFPDGIGGEYNMTSLQCDGNPCLIEHVNNVQFTQTETGWHIGAGDFDPYIMFSVQTEESGY